jgi:DNA replication protein DnaC
VFSPYLADDPHYLVTCDVCREELAVNRLETDPAWLGRSLLNRAGLPPALVGKPFERKADQAAALRAVDNFLDGEGKPPILIGPVGVGKTHLLASLAETLCSEQHRRVRYYDVPSWVRACKEYFVAPRGVDPFAAACDVPVLILDDLGAERKTDWTEAELQDVIDARIKKERPIIAATNLALEEWEEHFGARAASRLAGACEAVLMPGEDVRLAL